MEINITWNLCRICMQEEHCLVLGEDAERHKDSTQLCNIIAIARKQIFEISGVKIRPNDSLPQKICRKCLHFLKQAVYFRTTCIKSNNYLQTVLEKAKSTTSLFTIDKPKDNTMDELIDTTNAEIFGLEEYEIKSNDKEIMQSLESISPTALDRKQFSKKRKRSTSNYDTGENIIPNELDLNKKLATESRSPPPNEDSFEVLLKIKDESTRRKHKTDITLDNIFLSDTETDDISTNAKQNIDENVMTNKEVMDEEENNGKENEQNSNYLPYKTIKMSGISGTEENEGEYDDDIGDDEVHCVIEDCNEIIESNNSESVNIARNEGSDDLFYIFSDDVISKSENEMSNNSRVDVTLINASSLEGDYDNDDENIEEMIDDSETNTIDPISCIEECSRSSMFDNENENSIMKDDLLEIERALINIKHELNPKDNNEDEIRNEKRANVVDCYCDICGNQYNNRTLLKSHMRIHRKEKSFECEICFKRFAVACNLNTHMRTHTGEKPFECQYCQRRFSDKSTHIKHERTHTDERPYQCNICKKSFSLSSSLKAHERVHTGIKPFRCDLCAKSFKLPHQLKAHLNTNAHKVRSEEDFTTSGEVVIS